MRVLSAFLVVLAIGLGLGLGSAWMSIASGFQFGRVEAGSWRSFPQAGTYDVDPYARAGFARHGELPMGLGEGMALFASRDAGGRALSGRCRYLVKGPMPQARGWTLTVHSPGGGLFAHPTGRHGIVSEEALRQADGDAEIRIGAAVEPGNWVPVGTEGAFVLVLRLYDTPSSVVGGSLAADQVPTIDRIDCR